MRRCCLLLLTLLSLFSVVPAQETAQPPIQIEPHSLPKGWTNYFDPKQEDFDQRVKDYRERINAEIDALSPEAKTDAEPLAKKLFSQIELLAKTRERKVPPSPVASPIAPQYTIDEVLELNRRLRKLDFQITAKEDQLDTLKDQIDEVGKQLRLKKDAYDETQPRSEEKFLLGIDLLTLQVSQLIKKSDSSYLANTLKQDRQVVQHLAEELSTALTRLSFDRWQLPIIAERILAAETAVEETAKSVEEMRSRIQMLSAEPETDIQEFRLQQLMQGLISREITHALAKNSLIFQQTLFSLGRLMSAPDDMDTASILTKLNEWNLFLDTASKEIDEWTQDAQAAIRNTSRILSVKVDTESAQTEETPLQKETLENAQQNLLQLETLKTQIADSRFLIEQVESKLSPVIGGGEWWLKRAIASMRSLISDLGSILNQTIYEGETITITYAGIARFILIMLAAFWVAKFVRRGIKQLSTRGKGIQQFLVYRISRLVQYAILLLGLIVALSSLGFDFSNLVLMASALGIGLGFGLQSIFNNFMSGIILLFESQLKVGDFVELQSGIKGEIREIRVRSTIIVTLDGIDVVVPNSEMINNKVSNWTLRSQHRRMRIPFSVAYGTDLEYMTQVVVEEAKKVPMTLLKPHIPEPKLYMTALGDNGLEFDLVVWVTDNSTKHPGSTISHYLRAIESALRKANITIPFPQRDVHFPEQKK